MLSVLRTAKYLVWFWTPPSWPVRSLPRATLQTEGTSLQLIPNSVKPHRLSSVDPATAVFSGQLPHSPPNLREISARKFLENWFGGPTTHMLPTTCTGLERNQPP
jgi:hypothetical protein